MLEFLNGEGSVLSMSLPTLNSHLEKYEKLDKKSFRKDGNRYVIQISIRKIIYPYSAYSWWGSLCNLDCQNEYKYSDLSDFESFDVWMPELEKLLKKINHNCQ
jgi:hypothetical protein